MLHYLAPSLLYSECVDSLQIWQRALELQYKSNTAILRHRSYDFNGLCALLDWCMC